MKCEVANVEGTPFRRAMTQLLNASSSRKGGWALLPLIIATMLVIQSRVSAQSTTADILGTVTDSTGAILPGAKVKVTDLATNTLREADTSATDDYVVNGLNPGHYKVEASASGFKTAVVPDLLAAAGDRAHADLRLEAGTVTETVEVQSVTPLLQTDSSTVGTTLAEKAVQDLPLNGRNFVQLAQMTAGANQGPQNGLTSGARPDDRRMSSSISVNGQSDVINNEMVDGADNNERIIGGIGIRPSIDAISEIRVQTNDYTAEAGRTAGGVINIITKAGGNQFHSTVYEYFRNDVLDATNNVVQPQAGVAIQKSELRQNQFGGSLGGPIVKNKTFFFGDYEGFRLVSGQTQAADTPSYQELTDPLNSDLATTYGLTAISPIAQNWLDLFPKPPATSTCQVCVYTQTQNKTQFTNNFDVRIDRNLSPKDLFYARCSYNNVATVTPWVFPRTTVAGMAVDPGGNGNLYAGPASDLAFNFQMNYSRIFTPNLLLNLVASYLRIDNQSNPLNYGSNVATAFGFIGANTGDITTSGLTPVNLQGYGSVGDGSALPLVDDVDNTFQYGGTLTWTRGKQDIKVGASLIRRQALNAQSVIATGLLMNVFGATPRANLAYFLQGYVDDETRMNELDAPHYRMWESGLFMQDAEAVQEITGNNVELAYVDQGYTGENAAQAAEKHGVQLEVVKHTEAKRGFVLLPRRWVVERSFAWAACFRRLARDYERLSQTLAGLHYLAFAILMLTSLARLLTQSS